VGRTKRRIGAQTDNERQRSIDCGLDQYFGSWYKTTHACIEDTSHGQFQTIVRLVNPVLMDDEMACVPRRAYHGIVKTRPRGNEPIAPPMTELRTTFAHVVVGRRPVGRNVVMEQNILSNRPHTPRFTAVVDKIGTLLTWCWRIACPGRRIASTPNNSAILRREST
jgi:hypothetical protein